MRVKMAPHACRITFLRVTKVKAVQSGFPLGRSLFSFTAFDDILERRVGENQAVDVIGVLSGYTDLMLASSDGRPTKRVSFELQNYERRRLRCTLWSDHAEQFTSQAASFHGGTHVIVIIQLGKVRLWQGRPGVSNCYFGTKVIINGDDTEVTSFRERVSSNPNIPVEPVKYLDFESLNIDYTLADFEPGCQRVFLEDVRELREPKLYVVVGKVVYVQKNQLWYYVGCCKCYRGVPDDTLDGEYTVENSKAWTCPKCKETGYGFGYRYKIQLRVKDHSGYASLCLFDTYAAKMLGVSAYDLYKSLPADADDETFPEEINALVGKLYVFMVNVSHYNIEKNHHVYTIGKISDEAELLGQFPAEMELLEDTNASDSQNDNASPAKAVASLGNMTSVDVASPSNTITNVASPLKTITSPGNMASPGVKRRAVAGVHAGKVDGSPVKKQLIVPKTEPK